jgi:tagatose-1,6-bisphosphate aldolase
MAWYQIVNAKSDSYIADRDAEDLLRQFAAAFHTADAPVPTEVFYGRAPSGARVYYFSLSPEAVNIAARVLASYDATVLAEPPDLTGWEKIRRV